MKIYRPSTVATEYGPPLGRIAVPGWGDVLITPIDQDAVRCEVYVDHPTAKIDRNRWRVFCEVRRGHHPLHQTWYGAAATGKWAAEHGGKPAHPRRLNGDGFRPTWGALTDQLDHEVVPVVRNWMDGNPDTMRRARIVHIDLRIAVLRRDQEELRKRAEVLANEIDALMREKERVA